MMTLHHRLLDAARRTKTTLYVITSFYVGVGFFVAIPAALSGDRLSAFLGFLIISGALACAFILRGMLRLTAYVCAVGETLGGITKNLERLTDATASLAGTAHEAAATRLLDLSSFGSGDPSVLAAARLDRDAFPRLATALEDTPPPPSPSSPDPRGASPEEKTETRTAPFTNDDQNGDKTERIPVEPQSHVTAKNLLREWKVGVRNGDLVACRAVYAALIDLVDAEALRPLTRQLEFLKEQTEQTLRKLFAECAHRRDIEGMLEIGERIGRLLPDRAVADEFRRLKPILRVQLDLATRTVPPLRLVHGDQTDARERRHSASATMPDAR